MRLREAIRRHFVSALLAVLLPLVLLCRNSKELWGAVASDPVAAAVMVASYALPHLMVWWVAAKRDATQSTALMGGLVGANVVLAFFLFGFGEHGPELLWVFYYPICVIGIATGHVVADRLATRLGLPDVT